MIDPRGLTPIQWADAMMLTLQKAGQADRLDISEEWRPWAVRVCDLPAIRKQVPPDPFHAATFLEWADRFNMIVVVGD